MNSQILKYFELYENKTYQILRNAVKAVLRGKFIALNLEKKKDLKMIQLTC